MWGQRLPDTAGAAKADWCSTKAKAATGEHRDPSPGRWGLLPEALHLDLVSQHRRLGGSMGMLTALP